MFKDYEAHKFSKRISRIKALFFLRFDRRHDLRRIRG